MLRMSDYVHQNISALSTSKMFAGIMIIVLNISSKFVTMKLSPSMESYLKYTFSRNVMVFCIAFVGCRDIYIALVITLLFTLCMDYLFNEESAFSILPKSFTDHHIKMTETMSQQPMNQTPPSPQQIKDAIATLQQLQKSGETKNTPS